MVDVDRNLCVENPANSPMHYNNSVNVGVVVPPDRIPIKNSYSYFDGVQLYNKLDYDSYVLQQQVKPNKGKFPPVLKVLGGLLCSGALIFGGIKVVKKLFHKIKL